jgi:regulatory protein
MGKTITALSVQKRNPNRVNLYLDGEFAFGLARIVAAWLYVGQELSDEKIQELQAEDEREVGFQQALRLLNYRHRSESELRKNLSEHKYSEEVIEHVIERLKRSGLVDDQRFAQNWVENRSEFRPRSKRALEIELRQRGLDREAIEKATEEVDDESLAYQAAQKQAAKLRNLDWLSFRQKMYAFLARRGFGYDVIGEVVRRVWSERSEVEDTP